MSLSVSFNTAKLEAMALAKVGNPLKEEPLQTSKTLCRFSGEDAELLTHCFLKSFKTDEPHHFHHHSDITANEVYGYAKAIFENPENSEILIENGSHIAKHLYAKSNHPNIKSGDLCTALISDVTAAGENVHAISIIKSESKVPFLQISVDDSGDLSLKTQQGIYPDKIDKGALIIQHGSEDGYTVYRFDKSGNSPHFWNRDFLNIAPIKDDNYHTKRYAELCTKFAEQGLPEEVAPEERVAVANRAVSYLTEADDFNVTEFEETALKEPKVVEQFKNFKNAFEEESGQEVSDAFTPDKAAAKKAKAKIKSRLKLDTGVDIRFSAKFLDKSEAFLEKGFEPSKHMKFIKIYYHEEK